MRHASLVQEVGTAGAVLWEADDEAGAIRITTVVVRDSPRHGRGVFAEVRIEPGQIVERCPVLLVEPDEAEVVSVALHGYVYDWGDGRVAVALGFGSLYNHESEPNADYEADHEAEELLIRAVRTIEPGDEVTIDYTQGGTGPLWFDPTG